MYGRRAVLVLELQLIRSTHLDHPLQYTDVRIQPSSDMDGPLAVLVIS